MAHGLCVAAVVVGGLLWGLREMSGPATQRPARGSVADDQQSRSAVANGQSHKTNRTAVVAHAKRRSVNDQGLSDEKTMVRVALSRHPQPTLQIRVTGASRWIDNASGRTAKRPAQPRELAVLRQGNEATLDGWTLGTKGLQIIPEESPGIWVNERQYRGSVWLYANAQGQVQAVNHVPLEPYIAAVTDAEMPGSFPAAAREAQAVVARTYAISCLRANRKHAWYDLFASPLSQNYLGVVYRAADGRLLAGETETGRQAALATAGLVCTVQGQLFRTYYSACCGGQTFPAPAVFDESIPPLTSVRCQYCEPAPFYRWERQFEAAEALEAWTGLARSRKPAMQRLTRIEPISKTRPETTLPLFRLGDGTHEVVISAAELRNSAPQELPSLNFTLSRSGDTVRVVGQGHGHGVGLCQWGARGLAETGATAEAILAFYYPGSELHRLPPETRLPPENRRSP